MLSTALMARVLVVSATRWGECSPVMAVVDVGDGANTGQQDLENFLKRCDL